MFTGIVECVGSIESLTQRGGNLVMQVASSISAGLKPDQSVAHNGVCLTVVSCDEGSHTVEIVAETLTQTNLGALEKGDKINLERSLRLEDRLDGHLVQGHVDTVASCRQINEEDGSWRIQFELKDPSPLLVPKGSICVNGVSLTVVNPADQLFEVAIIPYTFEHTMFNQLAVGDEVNIEFDIMGKYALRFREYFT